MTPSHVKGLHEYRSLDEIDVELEEALGDIRTRVERLPHGRVVAVIERIDRVTVSHHVTIDQLTERDIERVMTEKPRKREAR